MGKLVWPPAALLAPLPVVLVSTRAPDGRANLMTAAWAGIVCTHPPLVGLSLRPERLTCGIVEVTGEFALNLVNAELTGVADFCGVRSGRDHDKFRVCGLTEEAAASIAAPLVAESPLALECRVEQRLPLGSHDFFIARILAVRVEPELVDAGGRLMLERAGLVAWAHGHYHALGDLLGHFGFSVRRRRTLKRDRQTEK